MFTQLTQSGKIPKAVVKYAYFHMMAVCVCVGGEGDFIIPVCCVVCIYICFLRLLTLRQQPLQRREQIVQKKEKTAYTATATPNTHHWTAFVVCTCSSLAMDIVARKGILHEIK